MRRREFLQSPIWVAGVFLRCAPRLGEIRFCRVAHRDLLGLAPGGCIAEVDPLTEVATFLGSQATLVVDRSGWRVFAVEQGGTT